MRAYRVILAAALLAALPVTAMPVTTMAMAAEEVVTTARPVKLPTEAEQAKAKADAAARAEATKPSTDPAQVIASLNAAPPIKRLDPNVSYPAAEETTTSGPDDSRRQIHGSAGVSIGTGGYRSGYVTSIIPLGDNGTLGLAYSQTDYGKNNRYLDYGYDDYDGYGYGGYGGYGYGRYGYAHGGTSQSLGVSLDLTGRNATPVPDDCAPGFRAGGEYIEPLWVTRMRGNASCDIGQ